MADASTTHTDPGGAGATPARPIGSPIERPAPLRQAVFDALVEMIITRELEPGQHLVEKDLAASLGVSAAPPGGAAAHARRGLGGSSARTRRVRSHPHRVRGR